MGVEAGVVTGDRGKGNGDGRGMADRPRPGSARAGSGARRAVLGNRPRCGREGERIMELCGYCGFDRRGPLCGIANPAGCEAASPASRLARSDREEMERFSRVVWDTVWLQLDAEPGIAAEVAATIAQATADAFEAAYREQ